ncbi:MAG: hypothetical protein ABR909_03110 [Candidatus Bathyarchaeia archaeon]
MSGVSIDHIVSIIIFLAAILLFVGLFGQMVQPAITYQQNRAVATKCSDLLDTMLLSPGSPSKWGQENSTPTGFGVQDPEFTEYQLSAFSLMRLSSATGNLVEYDNPPNTYYTSISPRTGAFLLTPNAQALNYSTALTLLGINDTYGFQLTLTPDITVSITENQACSPLNLSISAMGTGFPFAGASINYCLILVTLAQTEAQYPSYTIQNGATTTDPQGMAYNITFPSVTDPNQVYAFIAYTHLDGIVGVGYHTRVTSTDQYVVPIVQDMASQEVALAHNYDLNTPLPDGSPLQYNATFVILTEDYTLSALSLGSSSSVTNITTPGNTPPTVFLPTCTTGILIVTYQQEGSNQGGVVMMPWGVSSLAFPVTFGGNPQQQEWVATDMRQVTVNNVAYQAKLSLWSTQGTQVTS